ncbi:MAG: hypothetical protein II802_03065, partial [Clostridia bacterium]|nr:hypothetical protein [Clostridia bacterium]
AAVVCVFVIMACMASCNPVDKLYGVKSEKTESEPMVSKVEKDPNYDYPSIMSDDRVISKFIDISKYDEENYANIYLGKRFNIEAVYDGIKLEVPSSYKEIIKYGFLPEENSKYDENSTVFSCETVKLGFVNTNGKKLTVYFYNPKDSSVKLSKCKLVKLKVENNCLYTENSEYGEFNINSVMNTSAITDIIDTLGMPSHFYAVSDNNYYLDYFLTEKDRRNGITVYIDVEEDSVTAIEWSSYK